MALSSIKDVNIGSPISFRSKNPNDLVVWQGTLESISTYAAIRGLENPAAYNEAVRQVDSSVSSDVTSLTYFIITVDNNSPSPDTRVFSDSWIQPGSLNILTLGSTVTVTVDDPFNSPARIVSLLASAGYGARVNT